MKRERYRCSRFRDTIPATDLTQHERDLDALVDSMEADELALEAKYDAIEARAAGWHAVRMTLAVLATIVLSLAPVLLAVGVLVVMAEVTYRLVLVVLGVAAVSFLFSITFAAVRAPFKIANLFVTAASGSASAWRFVSKMLGK